MVLVVVVAGEVPVVVVAAVVLVAGGDVVVDGAPSPLWQAANASKTARKPPRARRLMAGRNRPGRGIATATPHHHPVGVRG